MIYLDYCATTPVNREVLDSFNRVCLDYIGNPNSMHKLGVMVKDLINSATEQIASLLGVLSSEIIYTSGASEANNMAIKGIALKYQNRGKHIIVSSLEHSSVIGPISYLESLGFEIDFAPLLPSGVVDVKALFDMIRSDTILVSIGSVNSEVGLVNPITTIGKMLRNFPKCFFHCDMTQSIGKLDIPLTDIDLVSISGHKIFGLKGIGVLLKKSKILLEPLIHGGKSTTSFRSGTPAAALIVSFAKALRLSLADLDQKFLDVLKLNKMLREGLLKYDDVFINSSLDCLPYILNISVPRIKPETFQHALEAYDVYISTQTACSLTSAVSKAVYAVTHDNKRANSSLRISLSHLTTEAEITSFLTIFDKCYNSLRLK
ncbi:MAG: cysteine desulfurase family protein [Bacilli bacterium]